MKYVFKKDITILPAKEEVKLPPHVVAIGKLEKIKTENIDSASVGISGETLSTDLFDITSCPIPALPCRITLRDGFTAYAGTLVDEPDKFLRIRFYPVFDNDRMLRGFKAWSPSGTISSMHPANASEGESVTL